MVSDSPFLTISTLLGSCVACCLWDDNMGVGGMNHMLLTGQRTANDRLAGVNAMEILINDLQKLGARRSQLQAKVFGGARMVSGLSDIGQENCDFIVDFLASERIPCVSKSLGGDTARQLVFTPTTGKVRMKMRRDAPELETSVPEVAKPSGNDLELF